MEFFERKEIFKPKPKNAGLVQEKEVEDLAEWKNGATFVPGRMAEWSIAAVLKTVELQGSGGSNPSSSAEYEVVAVT